MPIQLQAVVAMNTAAFTGGLSGMMASLSKFGGMAMSTFGGVAGQVAAMWAAFGPMGAVAAGLQNVVKVGATFEQEMAKVSSYSQITGAELAALSDRGSMAAEELGFNLHQVGAAMSDIALAGASTSDEIMNTLIPSLTLAGATGGTTVQSTETLTAALKVFRMETSEAAAVADLFAGAIASSPLNMDRLADSMKYAGPAGSAFGMSMKQVVDEVAAFHMVGLRGQQAGTSFRMALIKLSDAATTGAGLVGAAMRGWQSSTEGLEGAVRRLEQAGVPTSAIIQELGARAGPGLAALVKLGSNAMSELSSKITGNSNVQKMYETQMGVLAGQFKYLKAQIEEAAKRLFTVLQPAFMKVVAGAKNLVEAIVGIASKFSVLGSATAQIIPLLVGTGGMLWAFGKLAAIIPGLGGSLAACWAGATAAMVPAGASLTRMATQTFPAVTTATTLATKALHANAQGFFVAGEAAYKSAAKMDVYTGGVTRVTAAQARAITSTKTFAGGLGALQVAALAAFSMFAGWKLGGWIREIDIGSQTIGEFVDNMAIMFSGQYDSVEANDAAIEAAKRNAEQVRKQAEEERKAAEAVKLKAEETRRAQQEEARAYDIAREKAMEKLRAEKNAAEILKTLTTASAETADASYKLAASLSVTEEAATAAAEANDALKLANDGVIEKANALGAAQTEVVEATRALNEAERASTDARGALFAATRNATDILDQYGEDSTAAADATDALTAAQSKADEAALALEQARTRLADATTGLQAADADLTSAETNLESAIAGVNRAIDRNISEFNTIVELVQYHNRSFDEARSMLSKYGADAVRVSDRARELGISLEDAGKDVMFMRDNSAMAAQILRDKYAPVVKDADAAIERFGAHVIEVARYALENGVSMEESAVALGIWKVKTDEAGEAAADAVPEMAKMGKEAIKFGSALTKMDPDKLTKIYDALFGFASKFVGMKIDLSWLRDVAQFRIPHLNRNNATDFTEAFGILATGIAGAKQVVGDVSWVEKIGSIRIPHLNRNTVVDFMSAFTLLAAGIGAVVAPNVDWVGNLSKLSKLDVPKLKEISNALSGLPTGTYDASVLISWSDNATLTAIEGHLSKLAALEGIIWR